MPSEVCKYRTLATHFLTAIEAIEEQPFLSGSGDFDWSKAYQWRMSKGDYENASITPMNSIQTEIFLVNAAQR